MIDFALRPENARRIARRQEKERNSKAPLAGMVERISRISQQGEATRLVLSWV